MLRLEKKQINMFKKLINSSITHVSSSSLGSFGNYIMFHKLSAKVYFKNSLIKFFLLNCNYMFGFYETEEGTVYYDYELIKNCDNSEFDEERHVLNSPPIQRIEIYGRIIPSNDLKDVSRYNNKLFSNSSLTDDVFLFRCKHNIFYAFVFENFLCVLSLYKSYNEFKMYFEDAKKNAKYRLNYVIE